MKLLIITQKVDINDPVLGFFHRWIEEFSKHCEKITVIALGVGEYNLPKNVKVFSLGKEKGKSRLKYVLNFYRLILRERKNYDVVFVHMNQEYVLLGGLFWKVFGKKITMWRNHYAGSFLTRVAMFLSDKIFCTSKYSFTANSRKTVLMPVGIDTGLFKKTNNFKKIPNSILFIGRITSAKKLHLIVEALRILRDDGVQFFADFYGNTAPEDTAYFNFIEKKITEYSLNKFVFFRQSVLNTETPQIYETHTVFVNSSPSGMYDKTIFEAMSCESLVLVSNLNLKEQIDDKFLFEENDENGLAKKLKSLLELDTAEQEKYGKMFRNYVIQKQSLVLLSQGIFNNIKI